MLQLRRLAPALARQGGCLRELSSTPALLQGGPAPADNKDEKKDKKESEEGFELLPPGCSMIDPAYGVSEGNQTVYFYDNTTANRAGGSKGARKGAPQAPTSLADAQQKLKDKKDAKPEEDEPYVYLPPGSSMREPGYNSMSDPVGGRVYYRDPTPIIRKK